MAERKQMPARMGVESRCRHSDGSFAYIPRVNGTDIWKAEEVLRKQPCATTWLEHVDMLRDAFDAGNETAPACAEGRT